MKIRYKNQSWKSNLAWKIILLAEIQNILILCILGRPFQFSDYQLSHLKLIFYNAPSWSAFISSHFSSFERSPSTCWLPSLLFSILLLVIWRLMPQGRELWKCIFKIWIFYKKRSSEKCSKCILSKHINKT